MNTPNRHIKLHTFNWQEGGGEGTSFLSVSLIAEQPNNKSGDNGES